MDNKESLQFCLEWIDKIRNSMSEVTSNRTEAMDYYDSKPVGKLEAIEGRSQVVTSDVADTIRAIMPSIMRIFASAKNAAIIESQIPPTLKDEIEINKYVEQANQINEKVNSDLTIKNSWFMLIYMWAIDALKLKTGFVKAYWKVDKNIETKEYENLTEEQFTSLKMQPNIKIIKEEAIPLNDELGNLLNWVYNVKVDIITEEDEYAKTENVPVEELGFEITARTLTESTVVYHRVKRKLWQIRNTYGEDVADKVEKIKDDKGTIYTDEVIQKRFEDLGGIDFMYNDKEDSYILYECYYVDKDTGKNKKAVICGSEFVETPQDNPMKRMCPFFAISPHKKDHTILGESWHDLNKIIQECHSMLLRQLFDSFYFGNNPRAIIDTRKTAGMPTVRDFLNNNKPGDYIEGPLDAIKTLEGLPINPIIFNMLEYLQMWRDDKSGAPRLGQGLNPESINKTARGIITMMQAGQQKIELIARLFAEEGIKELVQYVVDLNKKFWKKEQYVKVNNKWTLVNPEGIDGNYNVIVNVGIGIGDKETIVSRMQQLLGLYAQIGKFGVPIITPQDVYNTMKKLLEAMEIKDVDNHITNPQQVQEMQEMFQGITQAIMMGNFQGALGILNQLSQKVMVGYQGMPTQKGELPPKLPEQAMQPTQPMDYYNAMQTMGQLQ